MPLGIKYRNRPESPIASYTFSDLAEATGNILYYGATASMVNVADILTTESSVASTRVQTQRGGVSSFASTAFVVINEVTFVKKFNQPQRIRGDILANVSILFQPNTAGQTCTSIVEVIALKNGVSFGSASSANTRTVPFGDTDDNTTVLVPVTVALTNFKAQDSYAITVRQWGKVADIATNSTFSIAHDPTARTITNFDNSTQLKIITPYVIDL